MCVLVSILVCAYICVYLCVCAWVCLSLCVCVLHVDVFVQPCSMGQDVELRYLGYARGWKFIIRAMEFINIFSK